MNKTIRPWFVLGIFVLSVQVATLEAQDSLIKVDLPSDAPVSLVSADMGSSGATPRGGAMVVELHTSLRLRNSSQARIRGITLLVLAQEVTPGGKGSVAVPSLNVGPGETFPVRIDLRLLRPLQQGSGPLVRVSLDGVLFDDLTFYGPNQLNSRRSMTVWEMQARRDREYLRKVLAKGGRDGLREEMLASQARQQERPRWNVQVARRTTVLDSGDQISFAFVRFPGEPIEPMAGMARMAGTAAGDARIDVVNRSDREIRYLEFGWLMKDDQGREFAAGSLPSEIDMAPGARTQVSAGPALRFSEPVNVESMRGYLSQVEFADGEVWIPSREQLQKGGLDGVVPPSPEEQRLSNLYRRQGLDALVAELNKF